MYVATVEAAHPGINTSRLLGVAVDMTAYWYIFDVLRAVRHLRHLNALSAEAGDARARLLCQVELTGMADPMNIWPRPRYTATPL